jgi:Predicted esterase of the alpha-beta hydrolase superfamily
MRLIDWLKEDEFTLSLSAGFFGFFAHTGFVKALHEENLMPKLLTGSSAGAIVSACLASGMKPDEIEKSILEVSKKDFWDPALGLGYLKGQKFENRLASFLPPTFENLKTPLHIATYRISHRKTEIMRSGSLPAAVRASCAVPLMFHPVKINNSLYWDGGIRDKAGLHAVGTHDRVLSHFLISDKVADWFEEKSIKERTNTKFVVLPNLPRLGPNKLSEGKRVIDIAYTETKKALYKNI